MFLAEMKYFLDCVKKKKTPINNIKEAYEIQKIALAVKNSSKLGRKIILK